MSSLFLKAATALLSNRARSSCLKTAADVLIGNIFSDIRALSVYTPYFISSFLFISPKEGSYHSSLGILALAPFELLRNFKTLLLVYKHKITHSISWVFFFSLQSVPLSHYASFVPQLLLLVIFSFTKRGSLN